MQRCLTLLAVLLVANSCKEDEIFSRDYRVAFRFYTAYHSASILTRSIDNRGMFCIVKSQLRGSVFHLLITSNDMKTTEDIPITLEIETRMLSGQYMGANNTLIIGCSLYDGLKAYDGQCPVCLRDKGGINFPLAFIGDGQTVECTKCKRTYNLRAEGTPNDGSEGGKALLQYPIIVTEQYFEVSN